jgi:ParB family chromosome partitioning protein
VVSELARSIENTGILQPITVRRCEKGYQVVFGNHRVEACRRLGMKKISAVIREFNEEEAFLAQVAENLLRNTYINPIEEAKGYRALVRKGWTIGEIARKIAKVDSYVSERLSLLDHLHPDVQSILANGRHHLTTSHAELLSRVSDFDRQKEIAALLEKKKLSVRTLEDLLREVPKHIKTEIEYSSGSYLIRIPDEFSRTLRLKVGQHFCISLKGSKLIMEPLELCKSNKDTESLCLTNYVNVT